MFLKGQYVRVYSISEVKNNIDTIFESAYYDKEEVIIHSEGIGSVVVIPLDEYNSLKETNYLLGSKNNRKKLLKSLKELRN